MKKFGTRALSATIAAAAVAILPVTATAPASAAAVTGWVGPAGTTGFLHNSTIVNAPELYAESKIYQQFGTSAAPGKLGVRPRLFKSGALCEAVDYVYNYFTETAWTARTTATCGTGSYNSHGFVAVFNDSKASYDQYVTFPSNPLNWTAPAARTAKAQSTVSEAALKSGVNAKGQSYGSAATDKLDGLDLILAIGENGKTGYVKASDLNTPVAASPTAAPKTKPAKRTVPLYTNNGTTEIGQFTIN